MEGASAQRPGQKTADWLGVKKTPPDGDGGLNLEREEMIRILEEIIRDPDTIATARCTAIRTPREIPQQQAPASRFLYDDDAVLPMTGRDRRANKRLAAEQ
jgi:hypothetical protein